jgi:hypothetical protein
MFGILDTRVTKLASGFDGLPVLSSKPENPAIDKYVLEESTQEALI